MVTGHRVAPPIMHLKAVKDNRRRTHFLPHTLRVIAVYENLDNCQIRVMSGAPLIKLMKMKCSANSPVPRLAYHRYPLQCTIILRAKHPGGPSTGQQQSVASFMIRTTKSEAKRAEANHSHITEMIAKYMLLDQLVEGEGFRTYGFVKPELLVPSRKKRSLPDWRNFLMTM